MKFLMAAAAAAFLCVTPAAAQTYGSTSIAPGFEPDPIVVPLQAGGPHAASQADSRCVGYVADDPDYVVQWAGGSTLTFMAVSQTDTTLFILAPGEQINCDDDSAGDGDPGIIFQNAPAGLYQVWVGTFNQGPAADAQLVITERVQVQ